MMPGGIVSPILIQKRPTMFEAMRRYANQTSGGVEAGGDPRAGDASAVSFTGRIAGLMSASKVIRWAGLSAVVAGVLFVVQTIIHPPDDPSSVVTSLWAISHYLLLGYFVFGLLGISGIYARQVEEAGLLGLVGFLMFFVWLALSTGFIFIEAFILPPLATEAPQFVEGFLGIFGGSVGESNLGVLEAVLPLGALLYIVSGLLFGISILRAGILPGWAVIVFIVGTVSALSVTLLPEGVGRIAAVPYGLGLAWLGYALWSERQEKASEPLPAVQS